MEAVADDQREGEIKMFVGRRHDGSIYGTWTCRPQDDADHMNVEELSDDHPEVVQFRNRVLPPASMPEEDLRRDKEDQERVEREIPQLLTLVQRHNQAWTELETALSALLYTALNIQPKSSHIPYAIYYGLPGFGMRQTVVRNTIKQLIEENKDLELLRNPWTKIDNNLNGARVSRNAIVHGTVQTLVYGSNPRKKRALLSPLPFDVVRINRKIKENDDPGLDVNALSTTVQKVAKLALCIDGVNKVISGFQPSEKFRLPKIISEFEASLTALSSP